MIPNDPTGTAAHVEEPLATDGFGDTANAADLGKGGPVPISVSRYTLNDQINHGGMGVIYRATDSVLNREVAIKVLKDKYKTASGMALRFADEARITAQLQHPAIPPIHDLGTLPDGRPFLVMKLIKGQTLDELLEERPDPGADHGLWGLA